MPRWRVSLAEPALEDLRAISRWTGENFGVRQISIYRNIIRLAVQDLREGPNIIGARKIPRSSNLFTLHIGRGGRNARHLLLYRIAAKSEIQILRILHESMDIGAHLPPD